MNIGKVSMSPRFCLMITGLILFAIVAISGCFSPALPDSAVPPTTALTTVRVSYLPTISYGPLFIAKEEGYFARQGITVEFEKFQGGSVALPSLINGDIAVSSGTVNPSIINAISQGAHIRVVADKGRNSPGYSCNASGLMVRRDLSESGALTKLSDLKGKKIVVPSGEDYTLARILQSGNLTADDIEIVILDFPSSVVALQNGAIDAAVLTEPFVTKAMDSKVAVMLLPTEVYTPDFPHPLLYGSAFLDKDPELGRRFMVAYLEGARQYNLGKTERNLEILSNYTHIDRDLLQRTCWMPVAMDGYQPRQPFRDQIDWEYANKKIARIPDDDQIFDTSFIDYANGVLANTSEAR
jgi:NitT/TauT family transport system substrate-binding protein